MSLATEAKAVEEKIVSEVKLVEASAETFYRDELVKLKTEYASLQAKSYKLSTVLYAAIAGGVLGAVVTALGGK